MSQRSQLTSHRNRCAPCGVVVLASLLWTAPAAAYPSYDQGCHVCHGGFRDAPYTSRVDQQVWADSLHNVHRNTMLDGDCATCHTSPGKSPVLLSSSDGGSGLAAVACVGCHGRAQDDVAGNPEFDAGRGGYGAGLRQHHHVTGIVTCASCHADADPVAYTPVGEDVLPPYYASPGIDHPSIPLDPCNGAGSEDFEGLAYGLDNDGDGDVDGDDADCGCSDVDGDGYSPDGNGCGPIDCADGDPDIHPGTAEVCNGVDDDCVGGVDDALVAPACALTVGVCAGSTATCGGNLGWLACDAGDYGDDYQAVEVLCDGLDNDCDGEPDEGCACSDGEMQACGTDVGECTAGTQTCSGGTWGGCANETPAEQERCDGLDNDCDGSVDEDFPAKGDACSVGVGACSASGVRVCTQDGLSVECGVSPGSPTDETCNGQDDDCNGVADDRLSPPSCALTLGVCEDSTQACDGAGGWSACGAAEYGDDHEADETRCDGLDNDCDGEVDEACPIDAGVDGGADAGPMADGGLVDAAVPDPDMPAPDAAAGDGDGDGDGSSGDPGAPMPDAGVPTGSGGGPAPTVDGGPAGDDDASGCGCRIGPSARRPGLPSWVALPLLLWLRRRRDRR